MKIFRKFNTETSAVGLGYLAGFFLVFLATWLKYIAQPNIIPMDVPILYLLAIVPIAIYFGLGPAIMTCVLSLFAFDFYFIPPLYTLFPFGNIQGIPILSIFLAVGILFSYLASNLRQQNRNALQEIESRKQTEAELASSRDNLQKQLALRQRAEESARSLASRLLNIQEEERRAVARELHDEVGQGLTVLKMMVGKADRSAPEEIKPILKEISNTAGEVMKKVRDLSRSLRPGVLDELGLIPALESLFNQLLAQTEIQVCFDHSDLNSLSPDINITVYRITQEALTNIMRHSGVKEVFVKLYIEDNMLWLSIEDHGRGFDQANLDTTRSTGLSAMKERAALVGGKCNIESEPGKGTVIMVTLPLLTQAQ